MTLPQEYVWLGDAEPTPAEMDPIENRPEFPEKPKGGLWTSPAEYVDGEVTSGWLEWCERERWWKEDNTDIWLLTVADEPNVCTIDSMAALGAVIETYPTEHHHYAISGKYHIDFEMVAEDFDALHVTPAVTSTLDAYRYEQPSMSGWDCETVFWFDWCFEQVEYVGEVDQRVRTR